MYSNRRRTDQSGAGLETSARKLLVLSASLSNLARLDFLWALSTWRFLRSRFSSVLSSVTSTTRSATSVPNDSAMSFFLQESVNRTNQIVLGHVVVKQRWEKCALAPVNPFHKA